MVKKTLKGKKIAAILAFRDFRDIEYFIPRDILISAEAEVVNVSSQKGLAIGADGGEVGINFTVTELKPAEFDALIFIGGPGMVKNLDKDSFQNIAREAFESGKVLGAICIAPVILARAGVLRGKKATVWSGPLDKSAVKILKENGGEYLQQNVVIDGKLVTASGPIAAKEFGEALLKVLQ